MRLCVSTPPEMNGLIFMEHNIILYDRRLPHLLMF